MVRTNVAFPVDYARHAAVFLDGNGIRGSSDNFLRAVLPHGAESQRPKGVSKALVRAVSGQLKDPRG
jgi:hypothetical protein